MDVATGLPEAAGRVGEDHVSVVDERFGLADQIVLAAAEPVAEDHGRSRLAVIGSIDVDVQGHFGPVRLGADRHLTSFRSTLRVGRRQGHRGTQR